LRGCRADVNPDPGRFPHQDAGVTPVAADFTRQRGVDAYGLPTLDELFDFVQAYAACAEKPRQQRARAAELVFDLELKRVPGRPERIGDHFDGHSLGLLEERVLESIQRHGMLRRTVVRSFDHRSIKALKKCAPLVQTAVLVAATAPVDPVEIARSAGAAIYCPHVDFLDRATIQQLHAAGIAVWPWTVNDPADWERLLDWNVDGITTDYPDRLAALLRSRGIVY
jgi:glycerophosphoryl diester phosphodiesterase